MSASWAPRSSEEIDEGYPRFENIVCRCSRRARVKISESEKNKGRLYYCCDNEVYGTFLAWTNSKRCGTSMEVSSQRQRRVQRVFEEVVEHRRENAIYTVEVRNSINNAKNAIYVVFIVVFVVLLVVVFSN